jgi:hypothetical protein
MMRLVETIIINRTSVRRLPLSENTITKKGKKYKCRAAFEFPVWRLDKKNLNERTYSTALAEKVVKEDLVTAGLTNHPKEGAEGNVNDIFAVERNPHIREGILFVDAYLVGSKGEHAKEIIEAGGDIGLSSSAFGDLDEAGNVLIEGFKIERYADWVDNPSYEVFATQQNSIDEKFNSNIRNNEMNEKIAVTETVKLTTDRGDFLLEDGDVIEPAENANLRETIEVLQNVKIVAEDGEYILNKGDLVTLTENGDIDAIKHGKNTFVSTRDLQIAKKRIPAGTKITIENRKKKEVEKRREKEIIERAKQQGSKYLMNRKGWV